MVLQSIGVSQAEYAKRTGRTPQAMSSYVNAKQGCFPSNLLQEIVMLGFNGTWYLSGEGDMHQANKPVDQDLEGQYFERIGRKWGEMVEIFRSVESLVKNKNASKKLQLFDPFLDSNDSLSVTSSTASRDRLFKTRKSKRGRHSKVIDPPSVNDEVEAERSRPLPEGSGEGGYDDEIRESLQSLKDAQLSIVSYLRDPDLGSENGLAAHLDSPPVKGTYNDDRK